jgi:hypothetical protein
MRNFTPAQIDEVKKLNVWTSTSFHGNRKKLGNLNVSDIKEIVVKKRNRQMLSLETKKKTNIEIVRGLLERSKQYKGTSYFKIMIEGNSGIYYASPVYLHNDYNKCRLFDKTPETLKLMRLFNSFVNK